VGRQGLQVDPQDRGRPSVAGRADPQGVALRPDPLLQPGVAGIRVGSPEGTEEGPLGRDRAGLEGPPDPHAQDRGGTGIGPGQPDRLHHEPEDPLRPLGGLEHADPAHVLAAHPLGRGGQTDPIPRDQPPVDHRGRVVPRVRPVEEGIPDHRLPQVALPIGPGDPLPDRLARVPSLQADLLPQVDEEHRLPAVLAEGNALGPGDGAVLDQIPQDGAGQGGSLLRGRPLQGGRHLSGQLHAGPAEEPLHRLPHPIHRKDAHVLSSLPFPRFFRGRDGPARGGVPTPDASFYPGSSARRARFGPAPRRETEKDEETPLRGPPRQEPKERRIPIRPSEGSAWPPPRRRSR